MWREKLEQATKLKEKGNEMFKEGEYGAAGKEYLEAMQILWTTADELGKRLRGGELKSEEAVMLSRIQVDLDILRVSLLLNQALIGLKLGDFPAVVTHCSQILSFQPTNVKALFRRGVARARLNKIDEAKEDLERAVTLDPTNVEARKELIALRRVAAKENYGSLTKVSSYMSECVSEIFGFCVGLTKESKRSVTVELSSSNKQISTTTDN